MAPLVKIYNHRAFVSESAHSIATVLGGCHAQSSQAKLAYCFIARVNLILSKGEAIQSACYYCFDGTRGANQNRLAPLLAPPIRPLALT